VFVPINVANTPNEVEHYLRDSQPRVAVVRPQDRTLIEPLARQAKVDCVETLGADGGGSLPLLAGESAADFTAPRDLESGAIAAIIYTSGTTGRPKGAVLRQEALLWNAVMSQHMHGLTSEDHVLTVLPFFHVGGLNIQTTPALQHGATVTIHARFAPDTALATIARDRPTLTVLVPAIPAGRRPTCLP
jgi:fatty-acyl-CoA synthase